MKHFEFHLSLSPEQYLPFYRGEALHVVVSLSGGQTMRFPAGLLRKFVHADGIHGDFVLTCDDKNTSAKLHRKSHT